ncbi:ATP-binding protein [Caldisericum exile]|uniref:histidine kinase n=1 Tax=Caldisericum exile (strain DSM 21853 / NBRC 104410 / AZM16c01) TaxID=511051 RepID=A0A7U6GFA2_CALEA|nr:ATP-binding protein [Caldisericum exile]BAL81324.1 putative two-component system sensor histidine kinase [Caldisericum exile AZM16c01]
MEELSLNILDIIENSLKANAKNIEVNIIEDDNKDLLLIEIKDDGVGMDEDLLKRVFDPFTTTSANKKVGLGLPLLKLEAESCDGGIFIESEKGKGTTVKICFRKSHVDTPPLGDIASTIVSVLATHPEVNLHYRHEVNQKVFEISTEDLRKICSETICTPLVLNGIRGFLNEQIKDLHGGA